MRNLFNYQRFMPYLLQMNMIKFIKWFINGITFIACIDGIIYLHGVYENNFNLFVVLLCMFILLTILYKEIIMNKEWKKIYD